MCDKLGGVAIAVQGALFEHNERRQLGDGAFIDIRSGWLTGGEELLDALLSTVPWRAERRQMYDRVVDVPRLVSFHDLTIEDPPHPQLARMRRRLNDIYGGELGEPFTTAGLCYYRDGSDSVAWHGDTIGRGSTEDTMVAIVSLGATRVFALRPRSIVATAVGAWRSIGDGRIVSTHLRACGAQDIGADGSAREHPVPAARRPLTRSTPDRGHRLYEQIAGALRIDPRNRPPRDYQWIGDDNHLVVPEPSGIVIELAGAR